MSSSNLFDEIFEFMFDEPGVTFGILFFILFSLIIFAISYLVQYYPLWKMAKKAGFPYPWFAWISGFNMYLLCMLSKKKFYLFGKNITFEKRSTSFWIYLIIALCPSILVSIIIIAMPWTQLIAQPIIVLLSVVLRFIQFVWLRDLYEVFGDKTKEDYSMVLAIVSVIVPIANIIVFWMICKNSPSYGDGKYELTREIDPYANDFNANQSTNYNQGMGYGQSQNYYQEQNVNYTGYNGYSQNTSYNQNAAQNNYYQSNPNAWNPSYAQNQPNMENQQFAPNPNGQQMQPNYGYAQMPNQNFGINQGAAINPNDGQYNNVLNADTDNKNSGN